MVLFGRKKKVVDEVVEEVVETLPTPPTAHADGRRGLADHRDYMLSLIEPLPPFGMQTLGAVGLTLCEDLVAFTDIPGVHMAQVDGYAVRPGDVAEAQREVPVILPIAARLRLGDAVEESVPAGVCVKVVAGSPMPEGTSAVVPLAEATEEGDQVALGLAVQPGQFVRPAGADIHDGETLLRKDDQLTTRLVGMLAGAGVDRVMVRPRPRVVVLATGVELVEPGRRLKNPADAYDVNSYLLTAAARAEGAEAYRVGVYTRDAQEMREQIIDQLIRADMVITTGGVSDDESALLREVLPALGLTDFAEVAMDPGQTQGFGLIGPDKIPVVMLPGNPLAAFASFQMLVRPLIRQLMGVSPAAVPTVRAVSQTLLRSTLGETTVVLGRLSEEAGGRRMVEPLRDADAHQLGQLAQANCLIILDEGTDQVPAGGQVQVLELDR